MPRIERTVPRPVRAPDLRRNGDHLKFIAAIGICLACGRRGPCEAAHVRKGTGGGMGLKPPDKFTLPLCAACHHEQHQIGEAEFFGRLQIDALDAALRLWTISGNKEAAERIIFRARQTIELKARTL